MDSRERILNAYRLQEPDRVPCSPLCNAALVAHMVPAEWQALLSQTDVTFMATGLGDLEIFAGAWYGEHVLVTHEGDDQLIELETPTGLLRSRHVSRSDGNWTVEYMVKDWQDLQRLLSIPFEPAQLRLDAYRHWSEAVGDEGLVMLGMCSAFRICLGMFGPQALYLAMADDSSSLEGLIATSCECVTDYVQRASAAGICHYWMGGSEHCGPGVVRPRHFHQLVTPYDRRIVAAIHSSGGTVNQHTHGKMRDIFGDTLEIAPDAISPLESGLRGDITLADAKAAIGDRVCLKGNLDDMAFLALATPQEVRVAAEDAIQQAAEGGGFILSGTDADIYSPQWVESFLIMAEVAREHPY
jgi:uroporphyrinogen decarboxylase